MKFGICVNMLPLSGEGVGLEYISSIAALGYDYVELPACALSQASPATLTAVAAELKANGLPCLAANHAMPKDLLLVGPEADPARGLTFLQGVFPRLSALGVRYFVFGSPWAKLSPPGWEKRAAFYQLAAFLVQAGHLAAEHGLVFVIEPNNQEETNMINTFGQAVELADLVALSSVRVLQDYYHLIKEKDTVDDILRYGREYLVHTHFARIQNRRYAVDEGEDPYYKVYGDALRAIGYQGGISMEAFVDSPADFEKQAAAALPFLRRVFHD